MKVGDYVRTKYGIAKCIKVIPIRENSFMYEFDNEVYEDVNSLTTSELEKYKYSPNIIDLIEIGDYVNGYLVTLISKDAYGRPLVFVGQRHVEENGFYRSYYNQDIKSIVTKEKFNQIEYKI